MNQGNWGSITWEFLFTSDILPLRGCTLDASGKTKPLTCPPLHAQGYDTPGRIGFARHLSVQNCRSPGWMKSAVHASYVWRAFGSQIEEFLLLYLLYHPQVVCYALATLVLHLRPPTNCPCVRLSNLPEALSLTATPRFSARWCGHRD